MTNQLPAMQWISVEDELPKESKDYWTYNPTSNYLKQSENTWFGDRWSHSNRFITHWMPLPQPPQEQTK